MNPREENIIRLREAVWAHYRQQSRSMPWREQPTPYYVMVSEIMLQQTQVERVRPKFLAFIERFPDIQTLAGAPLSEVLTLWSGLGYNRRAKFLWHAAKMVVDDFAGKVPQTVEELKKLPGIGENTAGAIIAYAYNQPVIFIETNIRTVLFHHFFTGSMGLVNDRELKELVAATLDTEHPREWYWALMDYGTYLKKIAGGRLTQSKHYKKQSPLKGSIREMRGKILRELTEGPQTEKALRKKVTADKRFAVAVAALRNEGMLETENGQLRLTDH